MFNAAARSKNFAHAASAVSLAVAICNVAAAAPGDSIAPATAPALVRAPASAAVEKLVASLTIEEKIDLIGGTGFATRAIPRAGIPAFKMSDGPVGARSPAPSTAYAAGIGLAAT